MGFYKSLHHIKSVFCFLVVSLLLFLSDVKGVHSHSLHVYFSYFKV